MAESKKENMNTVDKTLHNILKFIQSILQTLSDSKLSSRRNVVSFINILINLTNCLPDLEVKKYTFQLSMHLGCGI